MTLGQLVVAQVQRLQVVRFDICQKQNAIKILFEIRK